VKKYSLLWLTCPTNFGPVFSRRLTNPLTSWLLTSLCSPLCIINIYVGCRYMSVTSHFWSAITQLHKSLLMTWWLPYTRMNIWHPTPSEALHPRSLERLHSLHLTSRNNRYALFETESYHVFCRLLSNAYCWIVWLFYVCILLIDWLRTVRNCVQ